jgi:hypothetical protein
MVGMDAVATAMGLPGKIGGHGSEVQSMYDAGELDKIRAYCECDVLNLYALYIRWAYVTGQTDLLGHNAGMESLAHYLRSRGHERPHFLEFINSWESTKRPVPRSISPRSPMPVESTLVISQVSTPPHPL